MSKDLISRKAVMDYLREQQANVIIEKNKNGFVNADVCDGMGSAIGAFMNFIVQLPTVYDVDKVVEQITILQDNAEYESLSTNEEKAAYYTAYNRAIEKVKSGGVQQL